ncbi:hypothetical protein DY000_02063533 [Brassica cretica]|uniref:Uncharacterized protein n=1 Tax=Brassica cretica TaxID=69181 RepID=A0ABQ7AN57_BRACR|nr:hypothetical protein DY000_02063533 [Brassica cretica]
MGNLFGCGTSLEVDGTAVVETKSSSVKEKIKASERHCPGSGCGDSQTVFGTSFFVNSLRYGNVLGAAIGGVGYYSLVSWGQLKETEEKQNPMEERKAIKPMHLHEEDENKVPLRINQEESPV